ncbi:hypothetical protein T484DRAFT_1810931 [Baffinella frigidus]|nr:hypothetical protein T484DRAFT_1810931 [Cryptophyta sp. CCMP2293]
MRLATTASDGKAIEQIKFLLPNRLPLGSWHSLVATFDGSRMALFLNGNATTSRPLSASTPLAILYTEAQLGIKGSCGTQKSKVVVVGAGIGVHVGGIHSVRLWERAMPAGEVSTLYKAANETALRRLRDADETLDHEDALFSNLASPSIDTSLAQSSSETPNAFVSRFYGKFRTGLDYTIHYTMGAFTTTTNAKATATYVETALNPFFAGGYGEATIGVRNAAGRSIWQRMCFGTTCGLTTVATVRAQLLNTLNTGVQATHMFQTRVSVAEIAPQTQSARLRPNFFPTSTFTANLMGAASSLSFRNGTVTFLAVANYWVIQNVSSHGARQWARATFPSGETALILAAYSGPTYLYPFGGASLPLNVGGRVLLAERFASGAACFNAGGGTYVVLSIFRNANASVPEAPSKLLKLSLTGSSVSATLVQDLPTRAAHGVEAMDVGDSLVLIFPALDPSAPTRVFSAPRHFTGGMPSREIQPMTTRLARNARGTPFREILPISTRLARNVRSYWDVGVAAHFAVVAQEENGALLLRWNGSELLGPPTSSSLVSDWAGGQSLGGPVLAAGVFPVGNGSNAEMAPTLDAGAGMVLVGSSGAASSGVYFGTQVLGAIRTIEEGLAGASAVVVLGANRTVEEGLAGASAVVVTRRPVADGGGELVIVAGMFDTGLAAYEWDEVHPNP